MSRPVIKFAAAAVVYAGFAVYLYHPFFEHFDRLGYLVLVNACLAGLGCFVLSGRWVRSWFCSFFSGAVYGFGPFMLGVSSYHPTAGVLAAVIPWLFVPAAFGAKDKLKLLEAPLSLLPFLGILFFFKAAAHFRLFAIPIQTRLHFSDLVGLISPLANTRECLSPIGFYHIPMAGLIMGVLMLIIARRFGIITIILVSFILAFCKTFAQVSPVMWFSITAVCCSIIIGAGLQGLLSAGFSDRKWVLGILIVMTGLAAVTMIATVGHAAKMYMLGAIVVGYILFMARAKARSYQMRLIMLCLALGVDIFFSAKYIAGGIF